MYIEKFGWGETDFIEARGDYGDILYYNDPCEVPERFREVISRQSWMILCCCASRMGVDVVDLTEDYLIEYEEYQ